LSQDKQGEFHPNSTRIKVNHHYYTGQSSTEMHCARILPWRVYSWKVQAGEGEREGGIH